MQQSSQQNSSMRSCVNVGKHQQKQQMNNSEQAHQHNCKFMGFNHYEKL